MTLEERFENFLETNQFERYRLDQLTIEHLLRVGFYNGLEQGMHLGMTDETPKRTYRQICKENANHKRMMFED